ncbi:uncharacterized protein LOC104935326 [Larimichthys crocea]|uniref:uncharacterized protein LOC104935326 n=1 Tax=Larimichthys crocea TaxID=215358 RepID=UPI000F5E817D|nr:uncharacterized protein LOC104935326 [Larimichthys crocea]
MFPLEKDLVMGMIKQALDGVELSASPHQQNLQQLQALPGASPQIHGPSFDQSWRKPQRMRLNQAFSRDKPERIGDAEVLEVHTEAESCVQDESLEPMEST